MKITFGKRNDKPAPRHLLMIQEREYATPADLKRAEPQIRRLLRRLDRGHNCFPITATRLYIARCWTAEELSAAGLPLDIYDWAKNR